MWEYDHGHMSTIVHYNYLDVEVETLQHKLQQFNHRNTCAAYDVLFITPLSYPVVQQKHRNAARMPKDVTSCECTTVECTLQNDHP